MGLYFYAERKPTSKTTYQKLYNSLDKRYGPPNEENEDYADYWGGPAGSIMTIYKAPPKDGSLHAPWVSFRFSWASEKYLISNLLRLLKFCRGKGLRLVYGDDRITEKNLAAVILRCFKNMKAIAGLLGRCDEKELPENYFEELYEEIEKKIAFEKAEMTRKWTPKEKRQAEKRFQEVRVWLRYGFEKERIDRKQFAESMHLPLFGLGNSGAPEVLESIIEKFLNDKAPIHELPSSGMTVRALIQGGITSVGELLSMRPEDLLKIKNIGPRRLKELQELARVILKKSIILSS